MKTFFRWGLIVAGIAVLVGVIYNIFFHIWPFYPFWGWRYSHFGPRIWPVFPLVGLLILFVAGILIAKYFFQALRASSMPKKRVSLPLFYENDSNDIQIGGRDE